MSNFQKLQQILAAVFEVDEKSINANTSPDTIEAWDSLKHLNLVLALEEEFQINFDEDQVVEILSFELIVEVLKEKGISFD
jgi:acyl carrier protein